MHKLMRSQQHKKKWWQDARDDVVSIITTCWSSKCNRKNHGRILDKLLASKIHERYNMKLTDVWGKTQQYNIQTLACLLLKLSSLNSHMHSFEDKRGFMITDYPHRHTHTQWSQPDERTCLSIESATYSNESLREASKISLLSSRIRFSYKTQQEKNIS